jgi:hypothetical protein
LVSGRTRASVRPKHRGVTSERAKLFVHDGRGAHFALKPHQ